MPREKSVGAIIYRKEGSKTYYLLLHYATSSRAKKGQWGFAKGHVEQDESEEQTCRREVQEETGIKDLRMVPGFKKTEKYFFKKVYGLEGEARKKAPWVFKLVIFFLAETKTKEIKISDEHVGFVWLLADEAIKKITFKNSKELLKKANEFVISLKM
jgi:8-oxo-dGTP pyrophosphatase MutT (NUDIX family)